MRNRASFILSFSYKQFLPFSAEEKSLSMLPMVHIAGLVIGMLNPLSQGATVVTLPRFEPDTFLQSIQKYKVNKGNPDSIQSRATIGPPAKRLSNGVSLADRAWPN